MLTARPPASDHPSSAIAVALASSLFALTACGGGGGDSSTPSGTAGSAAGGTTAVASNAQGSTAAGNSATNGSTQQGPGAAVSGTQEAPGAAGSATQQGQGTAGSVLEQGLFKHGQLGSMGPGKGSSNSESQAALWRGKGIGTEYARRIHATCPTLDVATEWGSKAYVPSILSCVAGSYVGTDLWTGQRCEVNIAANGDVRASRGGRAFRPFSAPEFADYSWKDGAFYIQLDAASKQVSSLGNDGAEAVFVYFDPQEALKVREKAREDWSNDPEAVRIIQKMGDYFVVGVLRDTGEEMSRDDMIWCAIPR